MGEHRNALQPGYELHWYVIQSVLGQGGFGITYLALDTNLDQQVAIKEYLPVELAVRERDDSIHPLSGEHGEQFKWGLDRFISEARTLAQFKHPNIVRVFTVFTENNSAYMVMEFEQGQGLQDILKERTTIPERELAMMVMPLLDGLGQVHAAGFIHRDVKPANIFIRENGTPTLLDFGSARQSLGEHTRTLTAMVSPGFAPFEQYTSKGDQQGPWTDIYGLGATLYRAVVGRAPAEAMDRSEALLQTGRDIYVAATELSPPGYSTAFLAAIDAALQFNPEARPQSIGVWRDLFLRDIPLAPGDEVETAQAPLAPVSGSAASPTKITIDAGAVPGAAPEEVSQPRPGRWLRNSIIGVGLVLSLVVILSQGRRQGAEPGRITDDALPVRPLQTEPPAVTATGAGRQTATLEPGPAATAAAKAAAAVIEPAGGTTAAVSEPAAPAPPATANDGLRVTPSTVADAPVTTHDTGSAPVTDHPTLVSQADKRRLATLLQRLARHPDDKRAKKALKTLGEKYERKVRDAMQHGNLPLAEAYIRQMLALNPGNDRLAEVLERIQQRRDKAR